jgi:NarL family two-component system response regulator LiaR
MLSLGSEPDEATANQEALLSAQTQTGAIEAGMTDRQPIRVLIVDDHTIVRKGIRALLATEPHIEVVGEAQDGREAIAEAERLHPDVILMDLVMPTMSGPEAIRYIVTHHPGIHVLVLTSFADADKVPPAIKAGALGYLLKDSGPDELLRAIRQVYQGDSSLHPAIARKLLHELVAPTNLRSSQSQQGLLTDRENDVLQLVAQGRNNQDIAERLAISEATVRTHVSHILTKLGLSSRTQAALYALRTGLASLDESNTIDGD